MQTIQPCHLEDLLREEERRYEVWLRRPEGDVRVVDVFHVWGCEHAILLSCEVDEKGEWCGPAAVECVMPMLTMKR